MNFRTFLADNVICIVQLFFQYSFFLAYMPTPDHRYVLELGFTNPSIRGDHLSVQYKKAVEHIASTNQHVERVRIFNAMGEFVDNTSYVVDPSTRSMLEKVLQQRGDLTINESGTGQSVTYLFIDLKNKEYGSDLSRIVEITYNDAMLEKNASGQGQFHLFVALVALIIGGCTAFILSRYLSKPIAGIVRDVDRISDGDLDWKISPTRVAEFQGLE